jgi:putative transcriptional regulator
MNLRQGKTTSGYEALLLSYAAGALDQAQNLVVMAHLTLSPQARAFVRDLECVGGVLIETRCEPVAMSARSLKNVLNRLDQCHDAPKSARHKAFPDDMYLPECVQEAAGCAEKIKAWRSVRPGIHAILLPLACRQSTAHVFKLHPGICAPEHHYRGLELTLVLNGAFEDDSGFYKPGDLMIKDEEDKPQAPQACKKQGCVCLNVTPGASNLGMLRRLINFFR